MTDTEGLLKALTEIEQLGFRASASNRLVVRAGNIAHAALISWRSAKKDAELPEYTRHDDTKAPRG
jgi:hypothetical protein